MENNIVAQAIQSVQKGELAYCKFLSPNDTKATKAHQSGYLVGKPSWSLFLHKEPKKQNGEIIKISDFTIKWQGDFETDCTFTYYPSKDELRLTGFGKGFPFREESNVGD